MSGREQFGLWTLTFLVIANMIGAGVFTTSGFAIEGLGSPGRVVLAWAVGGVIALAKASWDWGFGDWESALGAASHMGRRDIAKVLMDHGARPTFFTFAMLGNLDAVRATIEGNPGIQRLHGPHGITLLAHAKFGGKGSKSTVAYLESLGDADIGQKGLPVPSDEDTAIQGVYAFGNGSDERLKVFKSKRGLAIEREGHIHRTILRIGPWEYHPTGAPAVKIRFDSTGSRPQSLTIVDAALEVTARRVQV